MMNTPTPLSHNGNGLNGVAGVSAHAVRPAVRDDFSFKDLLDLLGRGILIIRSKWLWGVLGALVVGGAVAFMLFKRPVETTAQTALLAQSTLDKVIGTRPETGGEQDRENNLRNHLSMMNSRRFLGRLAASFSPEERRTIAAPYLAPGQAADDEFLQGLLEQKVSVARERGREYYTISVSHIDPKAAVLIADRFGSEYLGYVQSEYREANSQGYRLLEKQAEMIRSDLARIESERLDFRKKNGIISRTENQGILAERLKRLDASLTETRIKRVGLETLARQAVADRARSEFPWDNTYLAGFANNETLRQELDKQVAMQAVLARRYGPNHPKLRDATSQIGAIQASIKRNFDIAVRDLQAQLDVVVESERLLKKEFDSAFESSIEIEKLASTYEILGAGVESKKITLDELERKIGEASMSSRLPADFMQVVDPAYVVKPRVPKPILYGVISACFALGAFLVTPLIVSTLDERVSSTSDVEALFGVPLVAAIPNLRTRPEGRAHVVRDAVDTVTTESFGAIAGHLQLGASAGWPKTVIVTSTLPEEGKSLVASNLASTFCRLDKKVALIDLDLRRPSQHLLHGQRLEGGFLNWAAAGAPEGDIVAALGARRLPDGVDLITAGGADPHPTHFLVGKGLERLFALLRERYDVLVLDTPPAGVFQDALVLARHATETLLVVREGVAPVIQVRKVIEDFARADFRFFGLVLNGFSPRNANKKLAYSYHAAAKGYSYGERKHGNTDRPLKAAPTRNGNGGRLVTK